MGDLEGRLHARRVQQKEAEESAAAAAVAAAQERTRLIAEFIDLCQRQQISPSALVAVRSTHDSMWRITYHLEAVLPYGGWPVYADTADYDRMTLTYWVVTEVGTVVPHAMSIGALDKPLRRIASSDQATQGKVGAHLIVYTEPSTPAPRHLEKGMLDYLESQ